MKRIKGRELELKAHVR